MKNRKLASVLISLLVALNLNFIGANQSQAAPCSPTDYKFLKDWVDAFNQLSYEDIDAGQLYAIAEKASKKAKSAKMRAAWKLVIKGMDKDPDNFEVWLKQRHPIGNQLNIMSGYQLNKRC